MLGSSEESSHQVSFKENNSDDKINDYVRKLFEKNLPADLDYPKDVTFIVGRPETVREISAHKIFLGIRSPVFNRMFNGQLAESGNCIKIPDIEFDAFNNILRYIYTDELEIDLKDFGSTYLGADKYLITGLCEKLLVFLKKKLSIDNSALVYEQILKLGNLHYKGLNQVIEILSVHAFLAFQSDEFLQIEKDTLIKILESDLLVIDEIDLFTCCLKWVKAELKRQNLKFNLPNQLNVFNTFKHLIRFPIMTAEQFFGASKKKKMDFYYSDFETITPAKSGLFSNEELKEFEKYFETKDFKSLATNYNFNKRNGFNVGRLDFDWKNNTYKMVNIDDGELSVNGRFVTFKNGSYSDSLIREGGIDDFYECDNVYLDEDSNYTDDSIRKIARNIEPINREYFFENFFPDISENFEYHINNYSDTDSVSVDGTEAIKKDFSDEKEPRKDEIYIYKIQRCGGNAEFEENQRVCILNSLEFSRVGPLEMEFKHFCKDNQSFIEIYPMIALRSNLPYRMVFYNTSLKTKFGDVEIKLDKIFNDDDHDQLDVQLNILNKLKKSCAWKLYFYVKRI